MLQVTIPASEYFDEKTGEFNSIRETTLQLEHSLVSVSKWESKWRKPFLGPTEKTAEECIDYVRCMTITQHVDPTVYQFLTQKNFQEINAYIEAPMTATTFSERENKRFSREVVTAEIIYYWMVALNIPFECQKWHLNKLIALVRVCNIKNTPQKKMSKREVTERNRALNEARRKKLRSSG